MTFSTSFFLIADSIFLWYFAAVNLVYLILLFAGLAKVFRRKKEAKLESFVSILCSESLPEISFIVPLYNEEKNILQTIRNLRNLSYRYKQIILVNDGSSDRSLDVIKEELDLKRIAKYYDDFIETEKIHHVYVSKKYPEFVVIDKDNGGGKFDALNAGINASYNDYFVVVDADTVIDDQSFLSLIRPLLIDPNLVAVGASVKLRNDCLVKPHAISTKSFPRHILPVFQTLEYMRSFLERQGWDYLGGNFVLAGSFAVFRRKAILEIGGYINTVAEDMEIIIRLHRVMKIKKKPYKIMYLPNTVAWTLGPEKLKDLSKQRVKWCRGILDCIWYHRSTFLHSKYGAFGIFVYPFWLFFEALEPIAELLGLLYIITAWFLGTLHSHFLLLFVIVTWGFNVLFTAFCILIEEFSFNKYPHFRPGIYLFIYNALENLGYRQLNLWWRLKGFYVFFKDFSFVKKISKKVEKKIATATRRRSL